MYLRAETFEIPKFSPTEIPTPYRQFVFFENKEVIAFQGEKITSLLFIYKSLETYWKLKSHVLAINFTLYLENENNSIAATMKI